MRITIASVSEEHSRKDASKIYYVVTDTRGTKVSTFHAEVLTLQPGDVIDAEIVLETKGSKTFTNLESFKLVGKGSPVNAPPMPLSAPPANEKPYLGQDPARASIEAQCAVKGVIELWIAGKIPDDHPLIPRILLWLGAKLPVQQVSGTAGTNVQKPTPTPVKAEANPPADQSQSDHDFETVGGENKQAPIPERPDPKTSQELAEWCQLHGLSGQIIKESLGITWTQACKEISATVNSLKSKFPERFTQKKEA